MAHGHRAVPLCKTKTRKERDIGHERKEIKVYLVEYII